MYCFKIAFLWVVFTLARCEDSLDIFDGNYLSPTVPDSPEARYNYLDANYKSMKDFFSEMTRLVEAMQSEGSGGLTLIQYNDQGVHQHLSRVPELSLIHQRQGDCWESHKKYKILMHDAL
ncbi:uncharacterized protein LOC144421899 isoform X2 [Styela clava]